MLRNKVPALIAAFILIGAIIWSSVIILTPKPNIVNVIQNGIILYTFDLNYESDKTITVEFEGRKNVIEISDGKIRMLEAECPDHICVDTGWLSDVPIVCLPNRLVINYADNTDDDAYTR